MFQGNEARGAHSVSRNVTPHRLTQTERTLTRLVITARPDSRTVSSHEKRNDIAQHPCIASVSSSVGEPRVARTLSVVPEPTWPMVAEHLVILMIQC